MKSINRCRRAPASLSALATSLLAVITLGCASAQQPSTSCAGAAPRPQQSHDATVRHGFADVEHWVATFDDPARDRWQKPAALVRALAIAPGMSVADLGAGTGYFSRYLSAAVGERGTVFAADPEPNLVAHLRQRAEQESSANVVPVLASLDNPRLPAAGVDLVLIVDTFHHIDDRPAYFGRLGRCLKPAGRVAIVDFKKQSLPVGPPPEHKLARDQVVDEMRSAGYRLVAEPDLLPYQYVLVFDLQPAGEEGAAAKSR